MTKKLTKKEKFQQQMRQHCDKLAEIRQDLEELLGDWTDKFDKRSGKWQDSEAGEALQEQINNLEEHLTHLEEVEQFTDNLAEAE
jgi:DNA repair exonuclease SbcCD ATPase subunit